MDFYIHNIDPVVFHIAGPIAVRWYGLSYLAGFIAGYYLLLYLSRKRLLVVPPEEVGNLVVYAAVFGVLVGGRLGYVLFYGLGDLMADPLFVFKLWEGGMSSHGGFLGGTLVMVWYSRKHGCSFLNLIDNFITAATVGIFFGRLANFINGELWGRATDASWAVIFPQEIGIQPPTSLTRGEIMAYVDQGILSPRHPSQLYEAMVEGLLIFGVLWALRFTRWSARNGRLSAAFLVLYGIGRIAVEFFREPDSTVYFGWLTKGQALSVAMVLIGAGMAFALRKREA